MLATVVICDACGKELRCPFLIEDNIQTFMEREGWKRVVKSAGTVPSEYCAEHSPANDKNLRVRAALIRNQKVA